MWSMKTQAMKSRDITSTGTGPTWKKYFNKETLHNEGGNFWWINRGIKLVAAIEINLPWCQESRQCRTSTFLRCLCLLLLLFSLLLMMLPSSVSLLLLWVRRWSWDSLLQHWWHWLQVLACWVCVVWIRIWNCVISVVLSVMFVRVSCHSRHCITTTHL